MVYARAFSHKLPMCFPMRYVLLPKLSGRAMPKLTKRVVDGLQPSPVSDVFAWDSELRGFGVRIRSGGHASYIIQYRNAERRTRRLTLGPLGTLTPEQARQIAREKLAAVCDGGDPAADKQALRTAMTVREVCDWYLEEAESGRLLGRRRKPIASSTLALDRSRIETHVKPLIGNRAVRGLTIGDLERFQADIAAGRTAKERKGRGGLTTGGSGVAGRTLGMLHTIFEQATRLGLIETNPARGARKIEGDTKRDRRLSASDIQSLGKAMRNSDESPVALAAIQLMLLTGFRRMEALSLQHALVDAAEGFVKFPSTKTGPQVRVIGKAAAKLIESQPRVGSGKFVFPGEAGNDHFIGIARVLDRLSAAAGLEPITPHLLRHTFASIAADLGYSELTIAVLLGHASRGVTQRYVHMDKAVRVAADEVAAQIVKLMKHALGVDMEIRH